ncbi:major facilitator family transporter [Legionella busanensis]|uniref:Major facilitator family transporter n=1 Tax=Legionella busanensis TaxID=190655 RepID=A0A378JMN0_9GAMM|nr:MFS transporter [Legionella busanensis]STX51991.1 major facilitator family transporter [Legionella busanensis]
MTKNQYKLIGLIALGGTLEFYDFTIYALFAPYLSQHFFANTNQFITLINTFAVFALGYLARPLGGIIFGHLGDKFGRKSAFSLSVFIMAIATLLIGCLPTYQSIGMAAPIFLIILRLLQGFSVGGEIPGAAIFSSEHMPTNQKGGAIGFVFMCITLGNTIGAGVGLILTTFLTPQQMLLWGWRIPFILGFIVGIISYKVRNKTLETPTFLAILKENNIHRLPLLGVLQLSRVKLFSAFLLTAVPASIISFFLYLPTYLINNINIQVSHTYVINFFAFLSLGLMTFFSGRVSDYINRTRLLIISTILLIVFSYPLFYGLKLYGDTFLWLFILGLAALGGMANGSYIILLLELFPANIRYSAVGFSYGLGIAVFGGIGPLAFTWLIRYLGILEAPAFYILSCAILTLFAGLVNVSTSKFTKYANKPLIKKHPIHIES